LRLFPDLLRQMVKREPTLAPQDLTKLHEGLGLEF
jgi:hypothetical protein